jgi:hypothetical protein
VLLDGRFVDRKVIRDLAGGHSRSQEPQTSASCRDREDNRALSSTFVSIAFSCFLTRWMSFAVMPVDPSPRERHLPICGSSS